MPLSKKIEESSIHKDHRPIDDIAAGGRPASSTKLDVPASPAKGILLTPGTAASRRKTVSFGSGLAQDRKDEEENLLEAKTGKGTHVEAALRKDKTRIVHAGVPRQSTLTRTLIEMSKQQHKEQIPAGETFQQDKKHEATQVADFLTDSVMGMSSDTTVDLSQPRSKSGQHWKTEYDQYHKRSNREIRRIIRYGQNVKSYATKKDSEATILSEKLRKESIRVASMEAKVSRLAAELKNAQSHSSEGGTDQTKLVSELAQQTALAIRYQQKADAYKARLQKTGHVEAIDEDMPPQHVEDQASGDLHGKDSLSSNTEGMTVEFEIDHLRIAARAAEERAAKLEEENAALKRSMARVKEEMMSYETRRHAREERLKKREAKHKAARDECEKRFARLIIEHEELLRIAGNLPVIDMAAEIQSIHEEVQIPRGNEKSLPLNIDGHGDTQNENSKSTSWSPERRKGSLSPRKRRLAKPTVDVWTISSPHEDQDNVRSSKEPTALPPSSVKHDIHRTLKEIDQNLITKHHYFPSSKAPFHDKNIPSSKTSPNPEISPAAPTPPQPAYMDIQPQYENRRFTAPSPRPSMISLASSPVRLQSEHLPYFKPSMATTGRSASLMSRTSTLSSRRSSALPAERAAAAKQRLARRSAEKRTKVASH